MAVSMAPQALHAWQWRRLLAVALTLTVMVILIAGVGRAYAPGQSGSVSFPTAPSVQVWSPYQP